MVLSILSRRFVHSFSISYRYGLSMEEVWTKYGDTMDKPICVGKLYGRFILKIEEGLNDDKLKFAIVFFPTNPHYYRRLSVYLLNDDVS